LLIFDLPSKKSTERAISRGSQNYTTVIQPTGSLKPKLSDDDVLSVIGPWPLLSDADEDKRRVEVQVVSVKPQKALASFSYEDVGTYDLAYCAQRNLMALASGEIRGWADTLRHMGRVELWNIETGERHFEHNSDEVFFGAVAFSPDGRKFAAAGRYADWGAFLAGPRNLLGNYGDGGIAVWDTESGEMLHQTGRLKGVDGRRHRGIETLLFSSDGEVLVSGEESGTITWWNVATGKQIKAVKMKRPKTEEDKAFSAPRVRSLHWLDSGRFLLANVGSYNRGSPWGELRVLDNETGEVVEVLVRKVRHPLAAVAVSGDGKKIAAATDIGPLRLWQVTHESQSQK
jgi:WD40 repeat protein